MSDATKTQGNAAECWSEPVRPGVPYAIEVRCAGQVVRLEAPTAEDVIRLDRLYSEPERARVEGRPGGEVVVFPCGDEVLVPDGVWVITAGDGSLCCFARSPSGEKYAKAVRPDPEALRQAFANGSRIAAGEEQVQ